MVTRASPTQWNRDSVEPDGQVLPDWLSWSEFETTVAGEVQTTGVVVNLPLTFYGPSVELGPGWVYGGESRAKTTSLTIYATSTTQSGSSLYINPPSRSIVAPIPPTTIPASDAGIITSISQSSAPYTSGQPVTSIHPDPLVSPAFATGTPTQTATPIGDPVSSLLPAIIAPILPFLLMILSLLYLLHRFWHSTHPETTTFPQYLLSLLPFQRHTKAYTSVPPSTDPISHDRKSPTEKSALLPVDPIPNRSATHTSSIERDDEIRDLVSQNQGLLQRLNLGLGWLTPGGSSSTGRVLSGHTLEKGVGRKTSCSAIPPVRRVSHRRGPEGSGESGNIESSGTSGQTPNVMSEDQLFFRAPAATQSSKGTSSGSLPASRRVSKRFSQRIAEMREGYTAGSGGDGFSVGVPDTPGSGFDDTGDLGEFGGKRSIWREGGERLRFPMPPKSGNRESYMSGSTAYYSAVSSTGGADALLADPSAIPHTPSPASSAPPSAKIIDRGDEEYRHAPLSAFGSHPPTPHNAEPLFTSPALQLPTTPLHQPQRPADSTIHPRPVSQVFSVSPPGSTRTGTDGRQSYIGESLLYRDKDVGGHRFGEFGEPIRPVMRSTSAVVSPMLDDDHVSVIPSIHTPSTHPSQSDGSSSSRRNGASREVLEDEALVSRNQALRGRRSQPHLFRASEMGPSDAT